MEIIHIPLASQEEESNRTRAVGGLGAIHAYILLGLYATLENQKTFEFDTRKFSIHVEW